MPGKRGAVRHRVMKSDGVPLQVLTDFEKEFGFSPSRRSWLEAMETKIINDLLDEDRRSIAELRRALQDVQNRARNAKGRDLQELHELAVKHANALETVEQQLNRRIGIARGCGFKPKVYRSASPTTKRAKHKR